MILTQNKYSRHCGASFIKLPNLRVLDFATKLAERGGFQKAKFRTTNSKTLRSYSEGRFRKRRGPIQKASLSRADATHYPPPPIFRGLPTNVCFFGFGICQLLGLRVCHPRFFLGFGVSQPISSSFKNF